MPMFVEQRKSYSWAYCNWESTKGRQIPTVVTQAPHSALEEESLVWFLPAICPAWALSCCYFSLFHQQRPGQLVISINTLTTQKAFFPPKLLTSLRIELKNYWAKKSFSDLEKKKTLPGGNLHWRVTWAGKCWENAILIKGISFPQRKPRAVFLTRAGNLQ